MQMRISYSNNIILSNIARTYIEDSLNKTAITYMNPTKGYNSFYSEGLVDSKQFLELDENKKERNNSNMYKVGNVIKYKKNDKIIVAMIIDINDKCKIMNIDKITEKGELVPMFPINENTYWINRNSIVSKIDGSYYMSISLLTSCAMPTITDYTYDPDIATTTITWSDNTTTTVTAEDKAAADQYTGFMTAYAKKAAGNTSRIQSIYERAIKLPEKKALAEQKAKEKEEEQRKIRENQKARKRRQRVRREARRRKEQYEKTLLMDEAKRLAEKEYGVPYEQSDWLKQSGETANDRTEKM